MKGISVSVLILLLLVGIPVQPAQDNNSAKTSTAEHQSSPKLITLSGKVGVEGKTLVCDKDNRVWTVINPSSLRASEGHSVTVKAFANATTSELKIHLVKLRQERTTAKLDDAAFRR